MPFNNVAKNVMLDALDETVPLITHVGIHTLTDPGTSTNANAGEATGGSPAYARQAVTWGAASSGLKSNSNSLTFDVPAGTYGFFTLWNTSSGNSNNYLGYIPFGGSNALKGFAVVDTTLENDQFFSVNHGMSDNDRVMLYNVFNETLPTGSGLAEGAILYVVQSTTHTFKVATSQGGMPIDLSAVGGGELYWQRVVPETFGAQGQIAVAPGALVLDATAI